MVRRLHSYESRAYWAENTLQEPRPGIEPHQSVAQRGQQQLSSILHMKHAVQVEINTAAAQYRGTEPQLRDGDFLFWDLRRYMHTHRMQLLRDAMQGVEAGIEHHWAKTVDELFSDVRTAAKKQHAVLRWPASGVFAAWHVSLCVVYCGVCWWHTVCVERQCFAHTRLSLFERV